MAIYVSIIDGMTNGTDEDVNAFQTDLIDQAGVMSKPQYTTPFAGTQTGTPDAYSNVAPGVAYIPDDASAPECFFRIENTAIVAVQHDATVSNPRIDAVVLFLNLGASVNPNGDNVATIETIKGAEAGSPTAPSDGDITTELGADTWIRLYNVACDNPFTVIETADITDTREYAKIDYLKISKFIDWTDFTPLSYGGTGSMTFTGVTVNTCKYMRVGRKVTVVYDLTGTSGGTGSFSLWFELPVDLRPNADGVYSVGAGKFADQTVTSTGKGGRVSIDATKIYTSKYDTSNWGLAAGQNIAGTIEFEID